MKLTLNESNRKHYSESFIKGWECGVERQYQEDMRMLEDIKAEIERVKAIMNEEVIEHDRKDIINFMNGLNQCLCIIDKHCGGDAEC